MMFYVKQYRMKLKVTVYRSRSQVTDTERQLTAKNQELWAN
ncbi:MAG: hypothetical protein PWQ37_2706 [Candidatus Petromonas sp.]|jgi:hypothetical protein|nr:hypothetical protein [Candidatus Petromonas sp.]